MMTMPTHFTPETMKFLRGIARHNDREWFEARRPIYERALRQPMLALIEEINAAMETFAPEHVRPPHKIMMRIYRDTRFSKDKRPYKIHIAAWWARRGMEKTSGGGFYLDVSPQALTVAAGVYMPERDQLLALRNWMAEHHEEYRALVKRIRKPRASGKAGLGVGLGTGFDAIDPQALTRMPKGFASDHPADELLRARNWGVRASLSPELALQESLAVEVARRFRLASPLVNQLNAAILASNSPHWPR
jgi:uncharacterized protein (TIGR02453 family)